MKTNFGFVLALVGTIEAALNISNCIGWPNGHYVIGCNNTYVQCKNNAQIVKKCSEGLYFDFMSESCAEFNKVLDCKYPLHAELQLRTPAACAGFSDRCHLFYPPSSNYFCCYDSILYNFACNAEERYDASLGKCSKNFIEPATISPWILPFYPENMSLP